MPFSTPIWCTTAGDGLIDLKDIASCSPSQNRNKQIMLVKTEKWGINTLNDLNLVHNLKTQLKHANMFKRYSYTPRTVYPIRNHVTKSTRSALNVYKGPPRTNATSDVQSKATRAECYPKQCNSCCGLLFANKTSTHYGFAYLRVGRKEICTQCFLRLFKNKTDNYTE